MSQTECYDAAADEAITAELIRCTLGQSRRLELRVDGLGVLLRSLYALRTFGRSAYGAGIAAQKAFRHIDGGAA